MNTTARIPEFDRPPQRVVSLVPSLTESLFDLGLGQVVVGVTDYCTQPAQRLRDIPRVGGTKNPHLTDILSLEPDLVLANQEENSQASVAALREAGLPVWLSFPSSVQEALKLLRDLAGVFHNQMALLQLDALERAWELAKAAAHDHPPLRYFCPIWFEPDYMGAPWWMTFNAQTYPHDLLATFGGENIFAHRERHYPLVADLGEGPTEATGERDTRYPRVRGEEILLGSPELILLPSEPFLFGDDHRLALIEMLRDTPAIKHNRVHQVDGSLITWHGTRLAKALGELPTYFSP